MGMEGRPCPCGSGKTSFWEHDARGIPLFRSCDSCDAEKRAKYRPSTFTGYGSGNYTDYGEQIEPDW